MEGQTFLQNDLVFLNKFIRDSKDNIWFGTTYICGHSYPTVNAFNTGTFRLTDVYLRQLLRLALSILPSVLRN